MKNGGINEFLEGEKSNLKFLTPLQVSKLLGVHRLTVYEWLKAGKLPALHIGQQYFISEEVLRELAKTKQGDV